MFHRLKNDFRLSIMTMLGTCALIGITPFAILRFLQGNLVAGIVDLGILASILSCLTYAWITGDTRRSGAVLAFLVCTGAVAVGVVMGEPGLFWIFPCLVTTFFLTSSRIAVGLNLASVLALMSIDAAFSSAVQMWTFAATATTVSACAFVFALRNQDQRERLEHLATVDPLTGVKNRRSMDEELDLAVANAERSDLPYALVMLDLDHFKQINDVYGHGVGDDVLTSLVALLQQNTRKSDQLFRFGGEEFVLLLPGVDMTGLHAVMNNLQHVLRKSLRYPGGKVTSSFGVALLRPGERVESWLARADEALYRAKEAGRDRIVFADDMDQPARTSA